MEAESEKAWHHDAEPALKLKGISKSFGPVKANVDIDLSVAKGAIHGIVGENGAGKSTLMSILYGFYKADKGEIFIDGKQIEIPDSNTAIAAGIGMVFQHFKLVENFTVLENIILGVESGGLLAPSLDQARKTLAELADEYELQVDPEAKIEDLSVGAQQRLEILKALYRKANILILDEPTGVLTPTEADHLFRILRNLKEQGKSIILITHKLREIMDATDTVSVMRRGEMTDTVATKDTSPEGLAELMVGRKVLLKVDKAPANPGKNILSVRNLNVTDGQGVARLKGIDLDIRAGEILGIAGVADNGQSELLQVLGGMRTAEGTIALNGKEIDLSLGDQGRSRRQIGISHVPEDRHRMGMIMSFSAWENSVFGYHNEPEYSRPLGLANQIAIQNTSRNEFERYDIRPRNIDLTATFFSGGNQQKVVIAREVERNPDLLLIGQPTRGVDIGAIEFIHKQIVKLRDQGKAILLVSVELEEILSLSDRVAVMFEGTISGERVTSETDVNDLGLLMAGMGEATT
ncbi:ABC transporter ATP-binding protein [Ruegeria sp. EL01]|jgi:simple sugar transport system ATP-binding protein|uniref:ABC transporter ATP-binding protein n=1 Tax=Ruegeria sp. EL01 TaxID=2107578 RepID=UPI000EA80185|nr:ABC transporter ATP-binding protein [Ruegeria sp. EL01]